MKENEVIKAYSIAYEAHSGQVDKGGDPYIIHPLTVAAKMQTEDEIIVAMLHDVIEDSNVTIEYLENAGFSEEILEAIKAITRNPDEDYFDYIHRVKANKIARKVKLADLWHNSQLERLHRKLTAADLKRVRKYKKATEILTAEA